MTAVLCDAGRQIIAGKHLEMKMIRRGCTGTEENGMIYENKIL